MLIFLGPIFDAHNIEVLLLPGSVGILASLICLSFSTGIFEPHIVYFRDTELTLPEYYQILLSFGVLGGMSASLLFNPSLAAIGHWFKDRRALATGLACTAGGLGGVGFPLIILYLAPKIGFPWAIRIIALICAVSLGVACFTLRKRVPAKARTGAAIDLKALREVNFGLTTLAIFLIEFAVFIPYSYISSYGIYRGFEPRNAYLLNALLNAGAVPGRALPGYVADRFGTFNTMCITALVCALSIMCIWLTDDGSEAHTTAFTVLFGFWSGAAISLTPVCVSRVCDIEDYGKRNGTAFFVASFGALIGIPIAGEILGASGGSYQGLIIFAGVFYIAAFVAFCMARGVAGGWKLARF